MDRVGSVVSARSCGFGGGVVSRPVGIPPELRAPDNLKAKADQGPPCRACEDCCALLPDDEPACPNCISCTCDREGRFAHGMVGFSLLRPLRIMAHEDGTITQISGWQVEFKLTDRMEARAPDLIDKKVRILVNDDGSADIELASASEMEVGSCIKCQHCECDPTQPLDDVCLLCSRCTCRRRSHNGRGMWAQSLLRGVTLSDFSRGRFGWILSLDDVEVQIPAVLDNNRREWDPSRRYVALLPMDGGPLITTEYLAPETEIADAVASAWNALEGT